MTMGDKLKIFLFGLILFFFFGITYAQNIDSLSFFEPSPVYNQKRCIAVSSLQVAGYGSSLVFLSKAWYSNYNHSAFHFFNDGGEWMQMDKSGHFLSAWYLCKTGINMFSWSGLSDNRSIVLGSLSGFLFLTGVEVLDGYSNGWGFSWADFTANTIGTGIMLGQSAIMKTHNASAFMNGIAHSSLKFSFHKTPFPALRSRLLGTSLPEQILKDYNGQTYWLSLNLSSFAKDENIIPAWLNIAFGYGAEGMLGAREGFVLADNGDMLVQDRYRQYYFSLDIDLTRIKTKSYFLKALTKAFSFIKIPSPAIEFSKKGAKLYPIYF